MSFIAEHWEALASLLLSVVAIAIAIISSRRTAKDATRQIESIKNLSQQTIENTTKEIESVKELAKMHIEVLAMELDKEMAKYIVQAQKADEESKAINNLQNYNHIDIRDMAIKEFHDKQPQRDLRYHTMYIQQLREICKRLDQLKTNLN